MKEILPVIFMLCLALLIWSIQNHLINCSVLLSIACVITLILVLVIWEIIHSNK